MERDNPLPRLPERIDSYQSALRFFIGFLRFVLPDFAERVLALPPNFSPYCVRKLLIVCPETCHCPPTMDVEGKIDHTGVNVMNTKDRAGQKFRDFKSSVYRLKATDADGKDELLFFSALFANSLMSMSDTQRHNLSGLTQRQMHRERTKFYLHLQQLLNGESNLADQCLLVYWRDGPNAGQSLYECLLPIVRKELANAKESRLTGDVGQQSGQRELGKQSSFEIKFGGPAVNARVLRDNSPKYKMTSNPKGICLIVNVFRFMNAAGSGDPNQDRDGSEVDVVSLRTVFNWLQFVVIEESGEVTQSRFIEILDSVRDADHSKYDAFVCIVMSHGRLSTVYTSDLEAIKTNDIARKFTDENCPSLRGKPKIFIFQSCQNAEKEQTSPAVTQTSVSLQHVLMDVDYEEAVETLETDAEPEPTPSGVTLTHHRSSLLPPSPDMVMAYSTLPGDYAYRDAKTGSLFIQSLVTQLQQGHELTETLKIVTGDVEKRFNERRDNVRECGSRQLPVFIKSPHAKSIYLTGTL